ncbi:hypothetical protein F5Y14DRAFT_194191 [Nemania sp. NC0429]|nr:hypothetical protein F5Y14DRAFT_194191 [Nemania sp. NC0429]
MSLAACLNLLLVFSLGKTFSLHLFQSINQSINEVNPSIINTSIRMIVISRSFILPMCRVAHPSYHPNPAALQYMQVFTYETKNKLDAAEPVVSRKFFLKRRGAAEGSRWPAQVYAKGRLDAVQ